MQDRFRSLLLSTLFLSYSSALNALATDGGEEFLSAREFTEKDKKNFEQDLYTINFNNISMAEFLRFVSKLTNLNFIFEEADVQFTVSFVSEEAVSAKNVLSAIAQVLRIHDLQLLEQDGNVLITKSTKVRQVAPIISSEQPKPPLNALIVTRIFRIKNANINSVASIIRPMASDSALIEISYETRQLIVTDIATNVEQIAALLLSLDSPHSPLEIETYVVKHVSPDELITLSQQILAPFTDGNTLLFVPQKDTNSIFIVSTPHLIEKAMLVMEDLDIPPKEIVVGKGPLGRRNVFVYKVENLPLSELVSELKNIVAQMQAEGGHQPVLQRAIEEVKEAEDTNSLIFLTDEETITQLKTILTSLDTPATMKMSYYLYKVTKAPSAQMVHSLQLMKEKLRSVPRPDKDLIKALDSMQFNEETDTLIFIGLPSALTELKEIVPTFDVPPAMGGLKSTFLLYTPQYHSGEDLYAYFKNAEESLKDSGLSNSSLLQTLSSMKWIASNNCLLFTGDARSIEHVQTLLASIDNPEHGKTPLSQQFYLYKLQNGQGDVVIHELKKFADKISPTSLQNQNLIRAIGKLEWIPANNAILVVGSPETIDQLKTLLADFDTSSAAGSIIARDFFLYKPGILPPDEALKVLSALAEDMRSAGLNDPPLLQSLSTARIVHVTESLLFTGTPETLEKVKTLLSTLDLATTPKMTEGSTFLLYKLQAAPPDQFMDAMKSVAGEVQRLGTADRELAQAINSMKYIKETNSVLFTGTPQAIQKIAELASKFDLSIGAHAAAGASPFITRDVSTFIIYNPKYVNGEDLISILHDFKEHLIASGVSNPGLFDAISTLQWIPKTASLLISGDQTSIDQVQTLLHKFDTQNAAGAPSIETFANTSFLVYKLQYHAGIDIQSALKLIATNLSKGTNANSVLSEAIESLQWIQPTNSLIATGPQDILIKLKELIQNIDVPLRQVFVEILVVQTSLQNTQNFGLQWGGQFQYLNKTIFQTGNFPAPSGTSGSSAGTSGLPFLSNSLSQINATSTPNSKTIPFSTGFDLGVIGDIIMHKGQSFISLGSLVNAIQLDNDSTVVINQKLITQDNRQSTVFVGTNVPYTGSLVTNSTNSTVTTANIEYRDVGVNLTLTPILGENDVITLDIVQDISSVVGGSSSVQTSTVALTGITTTHAHMETRVSVPDSKFLVLSGMIQDSKQHFRTGIPCLGSLPVIGALFSENDRTNGKANIIIFVRPKIVNSIEDYKKITEFQEWQFKDQARLPMLKEEIDEGIDTLKFPEDE